MSVYSLLGLLFCNVLWSAAYSISKILMVHYHPMEVAFLRFFAGGFPLLVMALWGGRRSLLISWLREIRAVDLRIVLIGVLTFFVSPLCQMKGLSMSRAIDGSLLIAMEPLVTILAAFLFLGETLRGRQIFSVAVALLGAMILSEVTWQKLQAFSDLRMIGNTVFLLSLFSEAAYSAVAKPVLKIRSPVLFMTVAVWTGIALLFGYNMLFDDPSRMAGMSVFIERSNATDALAVAYLGFACTAFAYLFWTVVLQDAPVSSMALTLYVQPVLGLVWGWWLLGEPFTVPTAVGAVLILAAVWLGSRAA